MEKIKEMAIARAKSGSRKEINRQVKYLSKIVSDHEKKKNLRMRMNLRMGLT